MNTLNLETFHLPRWVTVIHNISRTCGVISASMIAASVFITCQMIFVRFVMNASTIWQTEAVIYLMISATLVGLPYVQLLRGHVNVDLMPLLFKGTGKKILQLITLTVMLIIAVLMAVHGYELCHTAFDRSWRSDTVWGVRMWIPYMSLPIGFGILALQMVADIASVILGQSIDSAGGH